MSTPAAAPATSSTPPPAAPSGPAPSLVSQAMDAAAKPAAPAAAAAAPATPPPAAATSQDSAAAGTPPPAAAAAEGSSTEKPEGADGEKAEAFTLKLPEGVEPDAKLLEGVTKWAQATGLKQEQAQQLADFYAQHQQEALAAQQAALDAETQEWLGTIEKDPELGGQKKPETLAALNRVMAAHGSPELRALMDGSGLGNHPAVVRFLARIGRAMGEDSIAGSTGGSNDSKDVPLEELLYGGTK